MCCSLSGESGVAVELCNLTSSSGSRVGERGGAMLAEWLWNSRKGPSSETKDFRWIQLQVEDGKTWTSLRNTSKGTHCLPLLQWLKWQLISMNIVRGCKKRAVKLLRFVKNHVEWQLESPIPMGKFVIFVHSLPFDLFVYPGAHLWNMQSISEIDWRNQQTRALPFG